MSALTMPMASPKSPTSLKRTYFDAGLEDAAVENTLIKPEPLRSSHSLNRISRPDALPQGLSTDEAAIDPTLIKSELPPTRNYPTSSTPSASSQNSPADPNAVVQSSVKSIHNSAPTQQMSPVKTERSSKKEKLTFEEKEVRKIEKEFKDRQKAEEKAKKEEEKRARDGVKEKKRKRMEEQNKLKDEEKQRKEEENDKKARSQLRLNAFFVQPSVQPSGTSGSPKPEKTTPLRSRRSSVTEVNAMEPERRSRSISATLKKPQISDYEHLFPPFFLQSHTTLAPYNQFPRDELALAYGRTKIDECLASDIGPITELDTWRSMHIWPGQIRPRSRRLVLLKDIVSRIEGCAKSPIDLTNSGSGSSGSRPADLLKTVSMKFLKFREDVRPPYIGTCTKLTDRHAIMKLSRNPFRRAIPDTDYGDDSEAEWEEPGEGEDLNSEGEEEIGDEDEDDEMEGFLDDEEASENARALKRRPLGELEPICSGLCWEAGERCSHLGELDLASFKLDILMDHPSLPIDPYSTSYWQPPPSAAAAAITLQPIRRQLSMDPPRIPLDPIYLSNSLLNPPTITVNPSTTTAMKPPRAPKCIIDQAVLTDFKRAVEGSDLTKMGLVEILKKQFPKQSKDAIRDTLDAVAERVGPRMADRKWILRDGP